MTLVTLWLGSSDEWNSLNSNTYPSTLPIWSPCTNMAPTVSSTHAPHWAILKDFRSNATDHSNVVMIFRLDRIWQENNVYSSPSTKHHQGSDHANVKSQCDAIQIKPVANQGFPVGGGGADLLWDGGGDLRRGHFSVKMYTKMKELGPWRGVRLDPPMQTKGPGVCSITCWFCRV